MWSNGSSVRIGRGRATVIGYKARLNPSRPRVRGRFQEKPKARYDSRVRTGVIG
jgi:hypothetical protein